MLVFHDVNLAFLAVPKTGSTALEAALSDRAGMVIREPANLKHTPARKFDRMIRPLLATSGVRHIELCALIRHPVTWLGSWYAYRQREPLRGQAQSTAKVSFDGFVRQYCSDDPAPYARVGNPVWFLGRDEGKIGIDHLFQYEQIDLAIAFLEDRLGMEIDLAQVKVSPKADLTLSDESADMLRATRPGFFDLWESAAR